MEYVLQIREQVRVGSKLSRCVIITTRLPCMARKMIGSKNLHHVLPLDFFITQKLITYCGPAVPENSPIWLKIGEEVMAWRWLKEPWEVIFYLYYS